MIKNKRAKRILVGFSFVCFMVAIFYTAMTDKGVTTRTTYHGIFSNADGVQAGTRVYLMGISIGEVRKTVLQGQKVIVSIEVDSSMKIPIDSMLQIDTLDYFSEKTLSISPGFEEEYMQANDNFESVQNSVDFLNLLNDYLDSKIKKKKKEAL